MVTYSTPTGTCAVDSKAIPKADAEGKGYRSPRPAMAKTYTSFLSVSNRDVSEGTTYIYEALCKKHYLEAYAEVYPDAKQPNI